MSLMIRLLDWLNTGIKTVQCKICTPPAGRQERTIANYNEEVVFKMELAVLIFYYKFLEFDVSLFTRYKASISGISPVLQSSWK